MIKKLKGVPFTRSDINLLERELIENIERLDGEPKELKRLGRVVANRMNFIRAVLDAERIAERNGYEVDRTE